MSVDPINPISGSESVASSSVPAPAAGESGALWLRMPITTIMLRDPVTVGIRDSFRDVQALMHRSSAGHIPVLDEGRPVGLVTARDLARSLPVPLTVLTGRETERLLALPVGMIMSAPLVTLRPDATVGMAVDRMVEGEVGAVVVVDSNDGHLVGLATRSAIVALLAEVAG